MATKKKQTKKKQKPGIIRKLWRVYLIALAAGILFVFLVSKGLFGFMPDIRQLEDPRTTLATEIFSKDGLVLGKIYFREDRTNIEPGELPQHMVDALMATEDVRFRKHSGIDAKALIRAVIRLGRDGGGSTISQQLAKNLFHGVNRTSIVNRILQKIKEQIIAVQLEKRYTKDEIILMYFNTVRWGNSSGIKSAAKRYFNKSVKDLKKEEAAVLVGMLRAPTYYNPKRNPDNAKHIRNVVLNQMEKYEFIAEAECDSLKALELVIDYNFSSHNEGMATYFREHVRNWLGKWCKKHGYDMYSDGLRVHTTIDSKMQEYAEKAVDQHMSYLQERFFQETKRAKVMPWRDEDVKWKEDKAYIEKWIKRMPAYKAMKENGVAHDDIIKELSKPVSMTIYHHKKGSVDTMMSPIDSLKYQKQILHTGFMAMDPKSGEIRAWVGGINHRFFQYDHVNKRSTRQVGSTFKPIVYARAIEDQVVEPCEIMPTTPVTFELPDGKTWMPKNSTKPESLEETVYTGLKKSMNTITARVMKRMEPESPLKVKSFSDKLGIETEKFMPYPSICLGTMDISVFEMVGAYGAFANGGTWTEPVFITRIEDKNGNIIAEFVPKTEEAMSKQTAYIMCKMLQNNSTGGGTAGRLRFRYNLGIPVGGKTGTTQENSDGWFMGIHPELVAGAWVGCEDRKVHFRSTSLGQGANTALPIYGMFMQSVIKDKELGLNMKDFKKPKVEFNVAVNCEEYKGDGPDRRLQDEDDDDMGLRQ
jgi:penicillin-binding protein 1A